VASAKKSEAVPAPMPAPPMISEIPGVAAVAKLLHLAPGLYAVTIGGSEAGHGSVGGVELPGSQILPAPAPRGDAVEIFAAAGSGWVGPEGGTVVVRAPESGGRLMVTTYRPADRPVMPLAIQVARLDRAPELAAAPAPLPAQITLRLERDGERRFKGGDWSGERGRKQRIEAFSIEPLERLGAADIEYKAIGPNRRETPWVSGAKLCGGRKGGLAVTGFAVRVTPHLSQRYDVLYEGAFFESGTSPTMRNGEICVGERSDDPLEALNVRFVERLT
jgi:hypothetical protein